MANVQRLVSELRAALVAAREDDPARVVSSLPTLLTAIAELYTTPAVLDHQGERQGDVGGGDCYLTAKGLRDEVAHMPTHSGLGGVVWDAGWLVSTLEYLMRLLER